MPEVGEAADRARSEVALTPDMPRAGVVEARQPATTADVEGPRRRDRGGVPNPGRDNQPGVDGAEQRVDIETTGDSVDGDLRGKAKAGVAPDNAGPGRVGNGDFQAHERSMVWTGRLDMVGSTGMEIWVTFPVLDGSRQRTQQHGEWQASRWAPV